MEFNKTPASPDILMMLSSSIQPNRKGFTMAVVRNHKLQRDGTLRGEFMGLTQAHDTDSVDSPTHPVVLVKTKSGDVHAWHARTAKEQQVLLREQPRKGHVVDLYHSPSSGHADMITSAPDVLHGGVDRTHPDLLPYDSDRQAYLQAEVNLANSQVQTTSSGHVVGAPTTEARALVAMMRGERPDVAKPNPGAQSSMAHRREADHAAALARNAQVESMLVPAAPVQLSTTSTQFVGYVDGIVEGVQEGWRKGAQAGAARVRDQFAAAEQARYDLARSAAALDLSGHPDYLET
jgi:hypothetical protein